MSIQSTTSGLAVLHSFFRTVGNSNPSKNSFSSNSPINAIRRLTTKINQVETSKRIQPLVSSQSAQNLAFASQTISSTNSRTQVTGVNDRQISALTVATLGSQNQLTIQGQVDRAADSAKLTVVGGDNATVTTSGQYLLTGNLGSTAINLTAGESLDNVATRINQQTAQTGVTAAVQTNNLVLTSTQVGSRSTVSFRPAGPLANSVTGLDTQAIQSFNVVSQAAGSTDSVSGTIVSAADQARLVYHGQAGGTVKDTAGFRLTGSRGSLDVSITQGESLTSVASRINQSTASSGIIATVNGNDLSLTSDSRGSSATVQIDQVQRQATVSVTGSDESQVSNIVVSEFDDGTTQTLSGTVNQTATAASVALQGSTSGNVIDSATFQVTGSVGSSSISITQGESLASVAARVNSLTSSTGVQAEVSSNQLVLKSTDIGSAANVAVQLTDITHTNVATGVNSQQLSNFQINSLTAGASETLSGTVNQTATAASVALQGSTSGNVIDSATFQLTGSVGSSSISITQGESLASVAARVNSLTSSTGVQAEVSSNQLVLKSSDVGSAAHVAVQLTDITHTNVVSGVNSQQLSNFQVNSFTNGASQTLSGSITQTAGIGQLTFNGGLGLVGRTSTFTLSGSLGSVQLSTTVFQSLSTLAGQINAAASTTGVQAVVSGSQLTFKTAGIGSSATIGINVTSGTFDVSGGNGNRTANGTNAVATINGQTVNGTGNSFAFSDAKGSYAFTAVAGFTGALNSVNVVSQAGQFSVTGGNGNGTANGTNAIATINGQTVTGTGNSFQFSDAKGSYQFTTVAGFTGALDSVNVVSQAGQFSVTGGHGDGTANGTNAVATINGQTVTGTGNSFQFSDSNGTYAFTTAAGFQGSLTPIVVQSTLGSFDIEGGDGFGTAHGSDFVANLNGSTFTNNDNRVTVTGNHGTYDIVFANGFIGGVNVSSTAKVDSVGVIGSDSAYASSGTDASAVINGQERTGVGSLFTIRDDGALVTINFADSFTGEFDPITATRIDSSVDDTSALSSFPDSNSDSLDQSSLQAQNRLVLLLAHQDIEFGQVLSKLKQLQSLSRESLALQPKIAPTRLDLYSIEDTEVTREETSKDESSDSNPVVAAKEQVRVASASPRINTVV